MERTVIIPALDPDERLRTIAEENCASGSRVIIVDDGSGREYEELFARLCETCTVLHHEANRGKGAAIKTALRYLEEKRIDGVIGVMDADGQHLPEDMARLLAEAEKHREALILGARTIDRNIPWKSRMGNQITRKVFRRITGVEISDTQTGLRAFSSQWLYFMKEIPGERYEYEMNVLTACADHKIPMIEVPVETIYHDKDNSCSHFRRVRDSVRIYGQLLKFSLASFSSFILDYASFILFTLLLPGTPYGVAASNIMARIFSAAYNYTINCRLIFHEKQSVKTAADYLALAAVILVLNNIILQGFLYVLHIPVYPAKILTECTLFLISWLVQKKIIFRKHAEVREGRERL